MKVDLKKELKGWSDEIMKINRKFELKDIVFLNLFGLFGIGKIEFVKEVCLKWKGIFCVFDLRKVQDMIVIYYNMFYFFELVVLVGCVE